MTVKQRLAFKEGFSIACDLVDAEYAAKKITPILNPPPAKVPVKKVRQKLNV